MWLLYCYCGCMRIIIIIIFVWELNGDNLAEHTGRYSIYKKHAINVKWYYVIAILFYCPLELRLSLTAFVWSPPPWTNGCAMTRCYWGWFLSALSFFQRRCALGSSCYWSSTTTGSSTSLIWHGCTLTGIPQSEEAGDPTGSEAGPFGGTLRTIFQFMWVDLFYIGWFWAGRRMENFHCMYFKLFPFRREKARNSAHITKWMLS